MANLSMKSMPAAILAFAINAAASPPAGVPSLPSAEFMRYWKSGLAEITTYAVTMESRGEMRKAQATLILVYEELNADTRIKTESARVPAAKRVPVLKLDNLLRFNAGIEDCSIMTSLSAGLTAPGALRPFPPQKISLTSQDWSGHVYHQVVPRPQGLVSEIRSYLESEGDAAGMLPYPKGRNGAPAAVYYGDEMPILVRELDGAVWPLGTPRRINLLPGLRERRERQTPLVFAEAVLTKVGPEKFVSVGADKGRGKTPVRDALKWTLQDRGLTTIYYVEAAAPKRLLGWENSRGEKGEMIASLRDTYWKHDRVADVALRKKLGLD
jgi:hypothetical protein